MKNKIDYIDWVSESMTAANNVAAINNDVILYDQTIMHSATQRPYKTDAYTTCMCFRGECSWTQNMQQYKMKAPYVCYIFPNQIVSFDYISSDFQAVFLFMSPSFAHSLMENAKDRFPLSLSAQSNPTLALTKEQVYATKTFYKLLKQVVESDNEFKLEAAKHIILATFYSAAYQLWGSTKPNDEKQKTKQELLTERFLSLVHKYYKTERRIEFYANKLCLTPKYLSRIVKNTSGQSASEWIENFVMQEAKALLLSTNMTIQQISDELHFPSQSFFGKYIKRITGLSPQKYRTKTTEQYHLSNEVQTAEKS